MVSRMASCTVPTFRLLCFDSWREIIVIYNSAVDFDFNLPAGVWKVAMEHSDPEAGNDREVTGTLRVQGTAVTVLYRDS